MVAARGTVPGTALGQILSNPIVVQDKEISDDAESGFEACIY